MGTVNAQLAPLLVIAWGAFAVAMMSGACSSGSSRATGKIEGGAGGLDGADEPQTDGALHDGALDAPETMDVQTGVDADAPEADGSGHATGPGCPAGTLAACGSPTQCGPVVTTTVSGQPPPTGTGGTVAPGLYFLTSATLYSSDAGAPPTWQAAIELGSSTFAERSYLDGYEQSPISGSYSTAGNMLSRDVSCPTTLSESDAYSASTSSLLLILPSAHGTYGFSYQLQ